MATAEGIRGGGTDLAALPPPGASVVAEGSAPAIGEVAGGAAPREPICGDWVAWDSGRVPEAIDGGGVEEDAPPDDTCGVAAESTPPLPAAPRSCGLGACCGGGGKTFWDGLAAVAPAPPPSATAPRVRVSSGRRESIIVGDDAAAAWGC